jgi:hypothetical protein
MVDWLVRLALDVMSHLTEKETFKMTQCFMKENEFFVLYVTKNDTGGAKWLSAPALGGGGNFFQFCE